MYDKTTDVEIQKDWSLFLKTYFNLKEIAREYHKVHSEGIQSFAGSGKDVFGQLDWEMSLPNFWNFKFQADEARYSYIQLRRDQIIREKIDEILPQQPNSGSRYYVSNYLPTDAPLD